MPNDKNYFYIPQIKKRNQKATLFKATTLLAIIFSISFLIRHSALKNIFLQQRYKKCF